MVYSPPAKWISFGALVSIYLLIGAFTVQKRKQLADFHIDRTVIVAYGIAGICISSLSAHNYVPYYTVPVLLGAILVVLKVWEDAPFIKPWQGVSGRLILVAILAAFLNRIIITLLETQRTCSHNDLEYWLIQFYAPVVEEMAFRGFLVGYLQQRGWNKWLICLVQMVLFWFGHFIAWQQNPVALFTMLPIFGFIAWWLTVRSKNLVPSIIFHYLSTFFIYVIKCVF